MLIIMKWKLNTKQRPASDDREAINRRSIVKRQYDRIAKKDTPIISISQCIHYFNIYESNLKPSNLQKKKNK